ncbi:MAG: PD40 domain-containing protein [Anaerolineaceae bacterium]|nr:PD40 domain-containing protein [Anaerolineaceae bacterium]
MNPEELKYQKFEQEIQSLLTYNDDGKEFLTSLRGKVLQNYQSSQSKKSFFALKPVWIPTFILIIAVTSILIIGPQKVYASFMKLLGYIPGVGLVDQDSSIRILAKPVSLTRDGITVSVNQVVLSESETLLDFGVSGVPLSAYPEGEMVSGCIEQPFLVLPDGSETSLSDPIPYEFNQATFILPCIFNTFPGTVPSEWRLEMQFISAPPEFKILPVVDTHPTETPIEELSMTDIAVTPTLSENNPYATVSIEKYIETEDGYILLGVVRPEIAQGEWLQITSPAIIRDANNKKISYEYPMDIQYQQESDEPMNGGGSFSIQIKGAKVEFPITIGLSGVVISPVDPLVTATLTVDVGENPQPGDVIEVNQTIDLAGYSIQLLSMSVDSRSGYSFHIDPGEKLSSVSVQINGHQAVGAGAGSAWGGPFYTSLAYSELPTGQLEIEFSNPKQTSETQTWATTWQPENVRVFEDNELSQNVCWDANTLGTIPTITSGLDGKVIVTRTNPQLEILISNFDGSQQEILSQGNAKAALSKDGNYLAFTAEDGIHIMNLSTFETNLIPGIFGRSILWSPDGTRLANVRYGDANGIVVMNNDGSNQQQLTYLGYEELSGWSSDGNTIYYAIPGAGGNGFMLRSVIISTAESTDLFVLEDSSRKAPMSAISPDGKWIAYRAQNNNSLYLKKMDGTPAILLLENPAIAVNGIAWDQEGHLLGVSLITEQNQNGEIFIIAMDSCETYRLSEVSGMLDAVNIP